jgi:hypothetical protein
MAHGKALHAVDPVLRLGSISQRETIYRYLAREFDHFAEALEALLADRHHSRRKRSRKP